MNTLTPTDAPAQEPRQIADLQVPGRTPAPHPSARAADLELLALAPEDFLDTTHFDTVRFPPPPWASGNFKEAADDGAKAYTPYRGDPEVITAVAAQASALLGIAVDPAQHVILTPGTQAGLFTAIGALAGQGTRVALLNPEYLFSERILRFYGAAITHVPLHTDADSSPGPDLEALEAAFRNGVKVFIFSHPNNPTGAVYSHETIQAIATLCCKYDVTVIADELYTRLLHDGTPFFHLAAEPGMQERTITLLGPSKTESLSGYRLGVVVAPGEICDRMENVLSITALRAPGYAQHLLVNWLRDDEQWLAERIPEFTALRSMTAAAFARLPWLSWTPGAGTAYAWVDVSALRMSAFDVSAALLTEAGVLVSPGYQFGPGNEGFFRVCYARDEEQWQGALGRMVDVLDRLGTERELDPARQS